MGRKKQYPFRIRIHDPDIIDVFQKVSKYRSFDTKKKYKPSITQKIGWEVPRHVKRDGFYIKDGIVAITKPSMILELKPAYSKKKGYDVTFMDIL